MINIEDRVGFLINLLNKAETIDDIYAVFYTMLEQKYTQEEIAEVLGNSKIKPELMALIDEQDDLNR